MPGSFFDTNVLLYLVSSDAAKADRAEEILASGGVVSVQVMNEAANVARRKMGLSWPETHNLLSTMRSVLTVNPLTVEIHENGLHMAELHKLSIYDAMIVASALDADCDTLWSEDMQDGSIIGGRLRIKNPFR
jgi:predicted nucleic acid-binding protein